MKLCVDRKWFESAAATCDATVSPVTGEQTHRSCEAERQDRMGQCGWSAVLFKENDAIKDGRAKERDDAGRKARPR